MIAEYWPASGDVQVVSTFSADELKAMFAFELEWSGVFDLDVSPGVSADDGLRIGADVFGRLHPLQQ